VHRVARNSEFAAQNRVRRKWLIAEYADSALPDVLCHGLQRDGELFSHLQGGEKASPNLHNPREARRMSPLFIYVDLGRTIHTDTFFDTMYPFPLVGREAVERAGLTTSEFYGNSLSDDPGTRCGYILVIINHRKAFIMLGLIRVRVATLVV
jgi:hypothetical protein